MSPTLEPAVKAIPIPLNNVIVPSVAIKEGAEVLEINKPLNNPNKMLVANATNSAINICAVPVVPNDHFPLST